MQTTHYTTTKAIPKLNMRWIQLFFVLFIGLFSAENAQATHAVGADLTYTCINSSTNTYRVKLSFYRDCAGSAAPSGPTINISSTSGCTGVSSPVTLSQISYTEVSQVCAGALTSCSGGSIQGTDEVVYQADIQLPAGCDSYVLSYTLCCRNNAITNLFDPGNQDIYVETTINTNLAACNNSPQFSNIPVLYTCQGQLSNYNHGFNDPDGDSLVFSLINPRNGTGNISFNGGLSATNPLLVESGTTFQFNPNNGQMTFTPQANTNQVAVVSVLVEEYRNGQLIGSVIRDVQIIVSNSCTSNPPAAGNISPSQGTVTGSLISSCGGFPLNIDFEMSDPDVNDVLTATSDIASVVPGGSYTVTGTNPINVQVNVPTAGLASGTYLFTITVEDGACPNPSTQIFGYELQITNPSPTVSAAVSQSTICAGETVVFSGSGAVSYAWDNGVTDGVAFAPASSGTYTVIGTAANGCTDTADVAVVVNTLPNVAANATSTVLCAGESVTLSGSGANSYSWNNSVVDGNGFVPTSTATYTVTGTDGNGCTATDQVQVVVNNLPNVVANTTASVICQGQSVTLSGSGASSYSWDNGVTDGVAFSPSSALTYTVVGTDGNGCTATDQVAVGFSSNPAPVAIISANATQICEADETTLTAAALNAGETIEWYLNGNLISGANADTYVTNMAGNYYNVVTNADGCTDQSSMVNVSYYPQPSASLSATASNFCPTTTDITLTSSTAAGATYAWLDGGVAIAGETGTTLTITTVGNYQVVVTNTDGCSDTSTVFAPINASAPTVGIMAASTEFCDGTSLDLNADLDAGAVYVWLLDGSSVTNGGVEDIDYTATLGGTYQVEVTNTDGCTSVSPDFDVTVLDLPIADISANITSFCTGSSAILTAQNVGGASFEWFLNNNSLGTATVGNNSITASASGNYYVVVDDGCVNTSNVVSLSELTVPNNAGNISGASDLCAGESDVYSISNVSGATSYLWSVTPSNAASISSGQGTNSVVVNALNNNFTLSVIPQNTCGDGGDASEAVSVDNGFFCPDVAFGANQTAICEGQTVTFFDYSSSNASTFADPEWNFGAGASPATALGSGPHTVTYSTSGLKTVTLEYIDNFGFVFDSETKTDYINVSGTVTTSAISGDDTPNCSLAQTYSVTNTVGSTYDWTIPSGGVILFGQGTNEVTVDFASGGVVSVVETTASGCVGAPVNFNVACSAVSVSETEGATPVIVYPNPTSGVLNIDLGEMQIETTIELYTVEGRLIQSILSNNQQIVELSLSDLPSGFYMLSVRNEQQQSMHKVIRE